MKRTGGFLVVKRADPASFEPLEERRNDRRQIGTAGPRNDADSVEGRQKAACSWRFYSSEFLRACRKYSRLPSAPGRRLGRMPRISRPSGGRFAADGGDGFSCSVGSLTMPPWTDVFARQLELGLHEDERVRARLCAAVAGRKTLLTEMKETSRTIRSIGSGRSSDLVRAHCA